MFFNKKNLFIGFIVLGVVAIPPIIVLPPIIKRYQNINPGWNLDVLKTQLDNKESFIAYIGSKQCPHCLNLERTMKNSKTWKQFLEKKETEWKQDIFYNYVSNVKPGSSAWTKFFKDINNLTKSKTQILGTPTILFFKKGELIQTLSNKKDTWENFLKQIEDKIETLY